jgi:hypothetical protein
MGLGTMGGFKLQIEDRGASAMPNSTPPPTPSSPRAAKAPELGPMFSSYQINVPQLDVDLDRVKAKQQGVSVTDVFDTMQIYLGSLYVNDFNRFGRTYQVRAQADAPFRAHPEDILQLKTRNNQGEMVPLSSLVKVRTSFGPEMVVRYNGYTAADINGGPAPGYSSAARPRPRSRRIAAETLPRGVKFEWTDLTYQKILAGNAGIWVFPISAAARLPGPRRAVRKPDPAAGGHPDRADEHAGRADRRVPDRRRQQHLHADRPDGAGRAGLQERHPDRRVRPRTGNPGSDAAPGRDRRQPAAPAADPDDLDRLHHGRHPAGHLDRRRLGNAPRDGHRRLLRHARRDLLRPVPDAGFLCAAAHAGQAPQAALRRPHEAPIAPHKRGLKPWRNEHELPTPL